MKCIKYNPVIIFFTVLSIITTMGNFTSASTYVYYDDFETDKAMYDSWRHSHFVETVPDIHLYGLLHYEDGWSGRGLGFYEGWEVGGEAYLAYTTIPQEAFPSGGSVEFYVLGTMGIYGSTNGLDWSRLGTAAGTWRYFSLPINEGDPVHFLELVGEEDTTIIDDLQITIEYVFPSSLLVVAPNGGESLVSGSMYTISWQSQGNISEVLVEYSTDNGSTWLTVEPPNTGNSGLYDWLVPVVDSNQCLVCVSDASDPNISDTSNEVFTIFECRSPLNSDLNSDCYVDFKDFAILAGVWLDCGNPFDPTCGVPN